jgi:hypothetical protein
MNGTLVDSQTADQPPPQAKKQAPARWQRACEVGEETTKKISPETGLPISEPIQSAYRTPLAQPKWRMPPKPTSQVNYVGSQAAHDTRQVSQPVAILIETTRSTMPITSAGRRWTIRPRALDPDRGGPWWRRSCPASLMVTTLAVIAGCSPAPRSSKFLPSLFRP